MYNQGMNYGNYPQQPMQPAQTPQKDRLRLKLTSEER
jgi:hypothetical protein